MEKKYNYKQVEAGKYDFWVENNLFTNNTTSKKEPFTILLPPPNVTGKLHIGHALDNAIPDLLIRFKKLNGYDINWIPGMDHAGIATQAKVEERLWKEHKKTRYDYGREEFIKKVWEWKDEYSDSIRQQWKKLGLALNYKDEYFTYSKDLNNMVNHIFVKMYNEGLIYKDNRIIHWDCQFKTALSNIEVIYEEKEGSMYHFKYFFKDKKTDYLEVATTRPETIFADSCIVVNPNDKRYQKYIGKYVINPLNDKELLVIGDEYVDIDFGTGVMKCSPGHDVNDFELGKKYNLEIINIFNDDATLNENVTKEFIGLKREDARKKVIEYTKTNNTFVLEKKIIHNVGISERSKTVVEPLIKDQWFVKMKKLAAMVLDLQKSDDKIEFYPPRLEDTLKHWMDNIHDWTVSRQIWWGHQIPVWYHKETKEVYVNTIPPKDIKNWDQESDVLDTWFSSGLLPFSCFLNWDFKKNKNISNEFNKYFPTSLLVTGYDLIFFWVARMIFFNKMFTNKKPFSRVLFHGLVRDEMGRKMSKSLGNGVDPMQVIEDFGCDSLRLMLTTNSSPGQDIRFSEEKIRYAWNFINKLWNASRYILMNNEEQFKYNSNFFLEKNTNLENEIDKWILNKLSLVEKEVARNIDKYEFAVAGKLLIDFVWDDFCSWYIELSKVNLQSKDLGIKNYTLNTMQYVLKNILIMLHGFIPFVTEEIYQKLSLEKSILLDKWIENKHNFEINYLDYLIPIISNIREFRTKNTVSNSKPLIFKINLTKSKNKAKIDSYLKTINSYLEKIVNVKIENNLQFSSNLTTTIAIDDFSLEVENSSFIDKTALINDLNKQIIDLGKEIKRSESILANKNFIEKASKDKIDAEKEKYHMYKNQYITLKIKLKDI